MRLTPTNWRQLLLIVGMSVAYPACAALITYRFDGAMTDADSDPLRTFSNGARVRGDVTIDSAILGALHTIPWGEPAGTVDRRLFLDPVTELEVHVEGGGSPVRTRMPIHSSLELFENQLQVFPDDARPYRFDRYILTMFDVPGLGLEQNLYFVQLEFFSLSFTGNPSLFLPGPFGTVRPDLPSIQPYPPSGESYARGRFAFTPENRNIGFQIDGFEVAKIKEVPEPSSCSLFGLTFVSMYFLSRRRRARE